MKNRRTILWLAAACLLVFPSITNAQVKLTWKVVKYDLNVTLPSDFGTDRDLDVTATLELKNQTSQPFGRVSLRISEAAKVTSVST
ncbi:MAG: hypothetical protein OEM82_15605, partial [Acidobacteriota bacterium]|nr:hypothetical protein [Acidobacteriota bacterium]